ncbi:MAG: hypothetical protein EXR50_08215, partial [Dehalococcoidia bacterium]|nr:hypothetical protein [Dehalococcoidia bacterium]
MSKGDVPTLDTPNCRFQYLITCIYKTSIAGGKLTVSGKESPLIALPVPEAASERGLGPYISAIEEAGGRCLVVRPSDRHDPEVLINSVAGLYLIAGADIHPSRYQEKPDADAGLAVDEERDALEFPLVRLALNKDIP